MTEREHLVAVWLILLNGSTAICKDILLLEVAMQVSIECDAAVIHHFLHHPFGCENGWLEVGKRGTPNSIEIKPIHAKPLVAFNGTIWIEHWDHFEHKTVPEHGGLKAVTQQPIENSFTHPTALRLAWMHSSSYEHDFSFDDVSRFRVEVGDGEQWTIIPEPGLAENRVSKDLLRERSFDVTLDPVEELGV